MDTLSSISATEFETILKKKEVPVFDVRKQSEFNNSHIKDAHLTPLSFINDHLSEYPRENNFYVYCAGGYRSVIAASILKSRGIHNLVDIAGGFGAIKKTGIVLSDGVDSSVE